MVVACDHVLGTQVDIRTNVRAGVVDQERLILSRYAMGHDGRRDERRRECCQ